MTDSLGVALGASYSLGLSSLDGESDVKNSAFSIMAGIAIPLE